MSEGDFIKKDIKLSFPLHRGETKVESLGLRRPKALALQGCSLYDLMRMELTPLVILLPRITEPPLTGDEVLMLEAPDLYKLAGAVSDFLLEAGQ